MDYEHLLEQVKVASKEDVKKVIFEVDQQCINQVREMPVDEEIKKELIELLKNRTFLDMLLANALQ